MHAHSMLQFLTLHYLNYKYHDSEREKRLTLLLACAPVPKTIQNEIDSKQSYIHTSTDTHTHPLTHTHTHTLTHTHTHTH